MLEILKLERWEDYKKHIKRRSPLTSEILAKVGRILEEVRLRGDQSLFELTKKYDGIDLKEGLRVHEGRFEQARNALTPEEISALRRAAERVEAYHKHQFEALRKEWSFSEEGLEVKEELVPLERVGLYVPGGRAAYPSTALMLGTPARVAGVRRVVACSPPPISDATLVAFEIAGVREVYQVGGAQAIAAMAYGTESVLKVDKVVGPGNIYVTAAKLLVSETVGIDFFAGPSEVMVVCDSSANPKLVALELVAQAEHDPLSQAILVTTSEEVAERVREEVSHLLGASTRGFGEFAIFVVKELADALRLVDSYAPEHLVVMAKQWEEFVAEVKHVGSIFVGDGATVALGDYCLGPNHVLPTGGAARFASPLSVRDFLRVKLVQRLEKRVVGKIGKDAAKLAQLEGLRFHKRAVEARL